MRRTPPHPGPDDGRPGSARGPATVPGRPRAVEALAAALSARPHLKPEAPAYVLLGRDDAPRPKIWD